MLSQRRYTKTPARGAAGFLVFLFASEREPRAELELARSVHIVGDLSKLLARLSRSSQVDHVWVSVLRRIRRVVRGDIEAQRFRFSHLKCLVDREIQVARSPRANVVQIVRSISRNVGIRRATVFSSRLNKTTDVEAGRRRVRSALCRIADHIGPLIEI